MTLFLLILGFGCLFGLSYIQTIINKYTEEGSLIDSIIVNVIGIASSILISIINSVLAKMIIKFAELE